MGKKKYTNAQIMWLETNGCSKIWANRAEFRAAFNKAFELNVNVYGFNNLIEYYKIKICTKQSESVFTDEQKQWLIKNAESGMFKNCRNLTDTYNALFKECRKSENISSYLFHWGVSLNTDFKNSRYSQDMDEWLKKNYLLKTIEEATTEFNNEFDTNKTEAAIARRCRILGLKRTVTRFKKGHKPKRTYKTGDIISRKDEEWIKVSSNGNKNDFIPLRKYVWEKAYGKVPKGYCVVFLTDNHRDVSLKNLGLVDRRGTPIMCKMGWWTDNRVITGDGLQWCNLYYTAKDRGIV